MKKLVILSLIAVSGVASAQAHGHRHNGGSGWGWVGPAIVGTVIGYEMARQPVYQPQPQVIYQPQPVVIPQQPEVRALPQYSPTYPAPNGCFPVYTQQGQFAGTMCR